MMFDDKYYPLLLIVCFLISCNSNMDLIKSDELCFNNYGLVASDYSIDPIQFSETGPSKEVILFDNDSVRKYYNKFKFHNRDDYNLTLYKKFKEKNIKQILNYDAESGKLFSEFYFVDQSLIGPYRKYNEQGKVIDSRFYTTPETYKICYNEVIELTKRETKLRMKYRNGDITVGHVVGPIEYFLEGDEKFIWDVYVEPTKTSRKYMYPTINYTIDATSGKIIKTRYYVGSECFQRKVRGKLVIED